MATADLYNLVRVTPMALPDPLTLLANQRVGSIVTVDGSNDPYNTLIHTDSVN